MPRLPLINIGTYCRVKAIDLLLGKFLAIKGPKQIISLGAGSDTRPFHLIPLNPDLIYYELDFPIKTAAKAKLILNDPQLFTLVGEPVQTMPEDLKSNQYHLVPIDLRAITEFDAEDIPTLVLSECCLCYLSPTDSHNALRLFRKKFADISLVFYEPIGLNDEFGRVMSENLIQRGLCLPTFQRYSTLEAQKLRLEELGLKADANDILQVYQNWLSFDDRQRIAGLELLDEVEEMELLLRHYAIVWGSTSDHF